MLYYGVQYPSLIASLLASVNCRDGYSLRQINWGKIKNRQIGGIDSHWSGYLATTCTLLNELIIGHGTAATEKRSSLRQRVPPLLPHDSLHKVDSLTYSSCPSPAQTPSNTTSPIPQPYSSAQRLHMLLWHNVASDPICGLCTACSNSPVPS